MGCDIHDYVEIHEEGRWQKVGTVFPNPYHVQGQPSDRLCCWTGDQFLEKWHPGKHEPCNEECFVDNPKLIDHPFRLRNYDVFAILANVRNGVGFRNSRHVFCCPSVVHRMMSNFVEHILAD